jgi:hypothetical protein
MSRMASPRITLTVLALLLFAGCSKEPQSPENASEGSNAADVPLTAADLDRFLAVVQNHSEAMIPEFTPPDEDEALDMEAPAEKLVESFRGEVRRLFDAARQGAIWERDRQWSQALISQKLSGDRFAALVRKVSLAIMRVRLDARVDVDQLVVEARKQVDRAKRLLDEIDAVPRDDRTRESTALRAKSAERLGKAVALLEFAEMVRKISPESTAVVRKYSQKLKVLLPPHANDELLAELKELATPRSGKAQQAGYEVLDQDDER